MTTRPKGQSDNKWAGAEKSIEAYPEQSKAAKKSPFNVYHNYELWAGYTFRQDDGLTEVEIGYWARFHRWPLVMAVYLSMGQIPWKKPASGKLLEQFRRPSDSTKLAQLEDFESRLKKAILAADTGKLVIELIPDTRELGHHYVERLVPVRNFIEWARTNYESVYEPLFSCAYDLYKSPEHSAYGREKGVRADEVKIKIQERAEAELDAGCKCHNPELARYLVGLKKNGNPEFVLPGIIRDQYERHFNIATIAAFKKKGIPLRNRAKNGELRGKRFCKRPGHNN